MHGLTLMQGAVMSDVSGFVYTCNTFCEMRDGHTSIALNTVDKISV